MSADKVRCATCEQQVNSFCMVKKSKVAIGKWRRCSKYKLEPSKVKIKKEIPTIRGVPPTLLKDLRKEHKRLIKEEAIKKAAVEVTEQIKYIDSLKSSNPKHPLTGDLDRFISTAGKG